MAERDNVRILRGRSIPIAKQGLDEAPVMELVRDMTDQIRDLTEQVRDLTDRLRDAEHRASNPPYASSLDRLAEQKVIEAEKLAEQLKEEAKQIRMNAQAEADRIIAQARRAAQENADAVSSIAKAAGEKAQQIVEEARQRGASIEADGRRRAGELLTQTKQQLKAQISREIKDATERVLPYLEEVMQGVDRLRLRLENWDVSAEQAPSAGFSDAAAYTGPREAQGVTVPQSAIGQDRADANAADLYEGPIEVVVEPPGHSEAVEHFYEQLTRLPGAKIRATRSAADPRYMFQLWLDQPTPLLKELEKLEGVAQVTGQTNEANGDATPLLQPKVLVRLNT